MSERRTLAVETDYDCRDFGHVRAERRYGMCYGHQKFAGPPIFFVLKSVKS